MMELSKDNLKVVLDSLLSQYDGLVKQQDELNYHLVSVQSKIRTFSDMLSLLEAEEMKK